MRLTSPASYKIVFWAIGLVIAWKLISSGVLLEPLFLFLTGGTIPWTNVRMTPDAILTSLPFLFVLIVLLIFRKEVWRLLRWLFMRRGHPQQPAHTDDPAETIEAKPVQLTATSPKRPIAPMIATARLRLLHAVSHARLAAHALLIRLIPLLQKAAYYAGVSLGWIEKHATLLGAQIRPRLQFAWRIVRIELRNLVRFITLHITRFWEWLSPYLWRADRWLGIQFDALPHHPYIRHARHVIRDFKQQIVRLLRK